MEGLVDVVLPCLDEAAALPWVLGRMPAVARPIVVDNGSRDGSGQLAQQLGATVVHEPRRGYGAACHAGVMAATAPWVAVMDCDGTLDPQELERLLDTAAGTRSGANPSPMLVIGCRVPSSAVAWPWHLRVANRVVAWRTARRTGLRLRDIGPMRLATREPLVALGLKDRRSGYPVETVVAAAEAGWLVLQHDVAYAARTGRSKVTGTPLGALRSVRDMTAILSR
ncbi:MAG TPA: glycosyltransferase family 2 protein [Lapillicoccus sp.]|nr:glycosyltransferase family 2 protein [Lapillicoccus sp.]